MTVEQHIEIERRFIPNSTEWKKFVDWVNHKLIYQAYPTIPETGDEIIRFRKTQKGNETFYAAETKRKMDREQTLEIGHEISRLEFEKRWTTAEAQGDRILKKHRFDIKLHDPEKMKESGIKEIIVDMFIEIHGNRHINNLTIIEIKFTDVLASKKFTPPDWFGPEITNNPNWSNWSLATKGLPATTAL